MCSQHGVIFSFTSIILVLLTVSNFNGFGSQKVRLFENSQIGISVVQSEEIKHNTTTLKESSETPESTQKTRLHHLRSTCEKLNLTKFQQTRIKTYLKPPWDAKNHKFYKLQVPKPYNFITGSVYVTDGFHDAQKTRRNAILCAPAKTGTSSWRHGIMASYKLNYTLQDIENGVEKPETSLDINPPIRNYVKSMNFSRYQVDKFTEMLFYDDPTVDNIDENFDKDHETSILKILHVRHPFRRLYSAWSDKFYNYDHSVKTGRNAWGRYFKIFWIMAKTKISKFEDKQGVKFLKNKNKYHVCSFRAFLNWISEGKGLHYNEHWEPYHKVCEICGVRYDMITKLESFEEDVDSVLERLEATGFFGVERYNQRNADKKSTLVDENNNFDFDSSLVRDFLESNIDEEIILSLYTEKNYKYDFDLLGYDFDQFLQEFRKQKAKIKRKKKLENLLKII